MQVRFYKALWGMESMPVPEAIEKISAAGYDGFETPLATFQEVRNLGLNLPGISMLFPLDLEGLRIGIEASVDADAEMINVHAGHDWWSFDEGCRFWEGGLRLVEQCPIPVTFETHRGRLLFDPSSTAAYLHKFPELRITADFSHWTCVCESLLGDQQDALELAISRTSLLHARVGHEEGPQVPDPRTDRWLPYVEAFEKWWDQIHQAHLNRGETVMRIDPEFGPPNYMWTNPKDDTPVSDLWDVCLWMKNRLTSRFGKGS